MKRNSLRVRGENILDASDKPIVIRGFNVPFNHFKYEGQTGKDWGLYASDLETCIFLSRVIQAGKGTKKVI